VRRQRVAAIAGVVVGLAVEPECDRAREARDGAAQRELRTILAAHLDRGDVGRTHHATVAADEAGLADGGALERHHVARALEQALAERERKLAAAAREHQLVAAVHAQLELAFETEHTTAHATQAGLDAALVVAAVQVVEVAVVTGFGAGARAVATLVDGESALCGAAVDGGRHGGLAARV
jgi:hypothetical protein